MELGSANTCVDGCDGVCSSRVCSCDTACGGAGDDGYSPYHLLALSVLMVPASELRAEHTPRALPRRFGVWLIRRYRRHLSPRLGVNCRYTPSCSRYGEAAVRRYGLLTGGRLALLRIMRCRRDVPCGTVDDLK